MKLSNRNYCLFEPRDETGIAAYLLCEKLILFDRILLDHGSIREYGDVSTVSNLFGNKSSSKELEVAKQCTENLLDVRPHFYQVVEDIQRNGPPLFVIQRYWI